MLPFRPRRSLRPVRPRLPRRALLWYLAAAAVTAATGLTLQGALHRAAEAEAAYGQTRSVVVVVRAVGAGEAVEAADVEVQRWPRALVPETALIRPPVGLRALVSLEEGEVVLATRLSGSADEGPAALLAPDQRGVAVPVAVPGLPLEVGDHVDVLVGGAVGGGPDGDLPVGARRPDVVAADAAVMGVGEEAVVLAVPRNAAADVAAALTQGPVVLALRPLGG